MPAVAPFPSELLTLNPIPIRVNLCLSVVKLPPYLLHAARFVLPRQLMLPNPQHPPAQPPQRPRHPPVPRLVRRQLRPPERRVFNSPR
jgi:hypothetical protein